MGMQLAGGALLLALIVAGVVISMNSGRKSPVPAPVEMPALTTAHEEPATGTTAPEPRGDIEFLAEAEPLARKFLEATTIGELLPLVRDPAAAEPRMRRFYPDGKVAAPGLSQFNASGEAASLGKLRSVVVTTRDFDNKALAFTDTAGDMKVDWESWVGWSDMTWDEFRASKPADGKVFRVTLSPVEYYNFKFSDDTKWQSYRLVSPDQEHSIYGYTERGSSLDQLIRPNADTKSVALMLSLKFPEGATADDQVVIERFVNEGWVEEGEST